MKNNFLKKLFIIFSIFTLMLSISGCSGGAVNIDVGEMMKKTLPELIKVDKNGSSSANCQEIDEKWKKYKQIFNRLQSSNDIPEISTYIKNLEENQDFYKKYLSGDESAVSGESANQLINNLVWIQSPTNLMRIYNVFKIMVDSKNAVKNLEQKRGSAKVESAYLYTNIEGLQGSNITQAGKSLKFDYHRYFKEDIPTSSMELYISEFDAFIKSKKSLVTSTDQATPGNFYKYMSKEDADGGNDYIAKDGWWFNVGKSPKLKWKDKLKIDNSDPSQSEDKCDYKTVWKSGFQESLPSPPADIDNTIANFVNACADIGRYALVSKITEVQEQVRTTDGVTTYQLVVTIDAHLVNTIHYNNWLWNEAKMLGSNSGQDNIGNHSALISLIQSGVDSVNLLEENNINTAEKSTLIGAPTAQTNITNTGTGDSLIGTDVLVINYAYSNQSGALQEFRNNLRDYNEIADNSDGTVTSANKKKIGTAISNSAILESQNEKLKTNDLYLSTKEFSPNSHFTIDGILEDLINNTYANPNKNLGTDFYIRFANIPIACLRLNEINPNAQRELQKSQEEAETQGYHTIYTEQGNQAIKTWCVIDIVSQIGTNGFTSVPADDGNGTYVYDFFDDTFHKVSDVNNVNSDVMTITQEQQDELRKTFDVGQSFYCADTGHILLIQYYPLYTNGENDVRYPIGRKLYLNKDNMRYDGGNNYLWLTPATKPFAYLSEPVNNLYSNQIGLNLGAIVDIGSGQQIPGWENAVGGTSNSGENMSLTPVYRLP